jgi:hypothetical protein
MRTVLTWPVGHAAQPQRASVTAPLRHVLVYAASCTFGGAIVALALASVAMAMRAAGDVLATALVLMACSVATFAVVCEWRGAVRPLPERSRQVPRHWLLWPCRSCTAAAFGLMLGAGVFTHLLHAAMYVVAALIVLAPSVAAGVAVGVIYGGTRGAIVLVTWAADRRSRPRPPWQRLATTGATSHRGLAIAALGALVLTAVMPTLLS